MSASPTTTTMPTTQTAVQRNLRGLHLLESDQFADAIAEFSQALSTVKGILARSDLAASEEDLPKDAQRQRLVFTFHDPTTKKDHQDPEEEVVLMSDSSTSSCASMDTCLEDDGDDDDDKGPFVFQSPILVGYAATACLDGPDDFNSLVKFSAAILFNLALSYHLAAMVMPRDTTPTKDRQARLLRKALTFYKLAYTMMQDTCNDGVTETMAISNNLGHVQLTVGDETKAQQCYEHLLSTIMFVSDAGGRNSVPHFDGFFQSVQTMVLGRSHHRPAQAA